MCVHDRLHLRLVRCPQNQYTSPFARKRRTKKTSNELKCVSVCSYHSRYLYDLFRKGFTDVASCRCPGFCASSPALPVASSQPDTSSQQSIKQMFIQAGASLLRASRIFPARRVARLQRNATFHMVAHFCRGRSRMKFEGGREQARCHGLIGSRRHSECFVTN